MSSTIPSARVNSLVSLGLVGCDQKEDGHSCAEDQSLPITGPGAAKTESPSGSVSTQAATASVESACSSGNACDVIASPEAAADVTASGPETVGVQEDAASSVQVECDVVADVQSTASVTVTPSNPGGPLHRIAAVRKSQGLTERTIAKRMGIDIRSYRRIECATTDITLTELLAAQKALEVPMVDLLEDTDSLSRPVQERAHMVRVMKTAVAIRETKSGGRIGRLASMLCTQLTQLMPELEEVSGWPQFGARRGQSAVAKLLADPVDTSEIRG